MSAKPTIVIVGGIGGLTAALAPAFVPPAEVVVAGASPIVGRPVFAKR